MWCTSLFYATKLYAKVSVYNVAMYTMYIGKSQRIIQIFRMRFQRKVKIVFLASWFLVTKMITFFSAVEAPVQAPVWLVTSLQRSVFVLRFVYQCKINMQVLLCFGIMLH